MPDYRLYMLNSNGHIVDAVNLSCDDDVQATELAFEAARTRDVELWQGGRRVTQFLRGGDVGRVEGQGFSETPMGA